jgi:diamine N-acetyltransferase
MENQTAISFPKAQLTDIPTIQELAQTIWPATFEQILSAAQIEYMLGKMYDTDTLSKQITSQKITFIFICTVDQKHGFCAYEPVNEHLVKIHKFYLLPQSQGLGLGKKTIDYIQNVYPKASLQLNVNKYNSQAIAFYQKTGFKIVAEEVIPMEHGFVMDDFVMQKD